MSDTLGSACHRWHSILQLELSYGKQKFISVSSMGVVW